MSPSSWLARLLGSPVEGKIKERFRLPVLQREDGAVIKLGHLVRWEGHLYLVTDILVSAHCMHQVVVSVLPVTMVEESSQHLTVTNTKNQELDAGLVEPLKDERVSLSMAREGLARVMAEMHRKTKAMLRLARRHQLGSCIRRSVQRFLRGHALSITSSLGILDWSLDPGILGLNESTDWCVEHRIQDTVDTPGPLDLLLGQSWDLLVSTKLSKPCYRILLYLTIRIDLNQQLVLSARATTISGLPSLCYRFSSLRLLPSLLYTELGVEATEADTDVTMVREDDQIMVELIVQTEEDETALDNDIFVEEAEEEIVNEEINEEEVEDGDKREEDFENLVIIEGENEVNKDDIDRGDNENLEETHIRTVCLNSSLLKDDAEESYKIVILPNLENSVSAGDSATDSENTDTEEDLKNEEDVTDEEEEFVTNEEDVTDTVSTDLGYPNTESPTDEAVKEYSDDESPSKEVNAREVKAVEAQSDLVEAEVLSIILSLVDKLPLFKEPDDEGIVMAKEDDGIDNVSIENEENDEVSPLILESSTDMESSFIDPPPIPCSNHPLPLQSNLPTPTSAAQKSPISLSPSPNSKVTAYLQSLPQSLPHSPKLEDGEGGGSGSGPDSPALSHTSSVSRVSLGGRYGVGPFYGGPSLLREGPNCPFPEEWQFNTIPESIENDEDID